VAFYRKAIWLTKGRRGHVWHLAIPGSQSHVILKRTMLWLAPFPGLTRFHFAFHGSTRRQAESRRLGGMGTKP
jgi:hypothetical protein